MRVKQIVALALVGGLIFGSVGVAEAAKKKKKKKKKKPPVVKIVPTPVQFNFHRVKDGPCAEDASFSLSIKPHVDNGACGNLAFGAPMEVLIPAGQDGGFEYIYAASDGVPFVLDATKEVVGKIGVRTIPTQGQFVGGGQTTLEFFVNATIDGTDKLLGTVSKTYLHLPGTAETVVDYNFKLDAALDKKTVTALSISLRNRGASLLHGYYSTATSYITMPTLVTQKK